MTFRVSFRTVLTGTADVEASSKEEAEAIVRMRSPAWLYDDAGSAEYDTEVVSVSEKVDRKRFARSE